MSKVHKLTNIQKRKHKCPVNMKGDHSHDNANETKNDIQYFTFKNCSFASIITVWTGDDIEK